MLAAPQLASAQGRTTRAVVVSDLNESYGSTRYSAAVDAAARETIALAPDLVISTGDMIAGQRLSPPLDNEQLQAMWQSFDRHVTTPLAKAGLPFAVTPGNHDASNGPRFALERDLYRAQRLPRKPALDFVDATDYPFNYAFRVHETLFVSLDATHVGHHPGYKDGVRFVSQGCLGAAPRALLGTTQRSERSITVLELDSNGDVRIEAYGGAGFDRPVLRATLPPKITAHGATQVRDDLALPAPPGVVGSRTR